MRSVDLMSPIRQLAKRILQATTSLVYRRTPISSWPAFMRRIHEISVPRGVIPHETPRPEGTANINILIRLLDQTRNIPGEVAECGVFRGSSVVGMAVYLMQERIQKTIYGFDSFEGFAESVVRDLKLGGTHPEWKKPAAMSETSLELVEGKARRFGVTNLRLVKGFFEETLPAHSGLAFSFVHLDCDTYDAYRHCMEFFYPRMNPGGIILLDEYNDPPWPGCNKAVDEFLADRPERLQVITRDNYEKYYLVKQVDSAARSSVLPAGSS